MGMVTASPALSTVGLPRGAAAACAVFLGMANPAATFVPKHRARRNWDRIRQLQVAREGAPCRIPLGEFRVVAAGRPGGRGAGR